MPSPPSPLPGRGASTLRRRTIIRGGLLGALGFAGGAAVAVLTDGTQTAATSPEATVRPAIAEIFERRQQALRRADRAGWLADIAPSAGAFRQREERSFLNIQQVPVLDWTYRVQGEPKLLAAGQWQVSVQLAYRLSGVDQTPVLHDRTFFGSIAAGRYLLTDDRPGTGSVAGAGLQTSVRWWDGSPVVARSRGPAVVIGSPRLVDLDKLVGYAEEAVRRVLRIWDSRWLQKAVVIAPASQQEFGELLSRSPTGLAQLAAVTASAATLESGNTARIVINPEAFNRLNELGKVVLLTHELTHVALRQSSTQAVPLWLSEGFADYLAYSFVTLPKSVIAQELLKQVRSDGPPGDFPAAAEFDPTTGPIGPAYSGAWLACELLEAEYRRAGLLEFYRLVAGVGVTAMPIDAAFSEVFGTSLLSFRGRWQEYLTRLAAAAP